MGTHSPYNGFLSFVYAYFQCWKRRFCETIHSPTTSIVRPFACAYPLFWWTVMPPLASVSSLLTPVMPSLWRCFFMYLVRSRLLSIFLLVWALIVVWTRLYLGVHYPSDIFVGMVAGTLNASLCYLIYKRIERRVAPVSTYRTRQFTRTGYEVKDIDVVLCTIVFTCIYCIIRGVIEIGL